MQVYIEQVAGADDDEMEEGVSKLEWSDVVDDSDGDDDDDDNDDNNNWWVWSSSSLMYWFRFDALIFYLWILPQHRMWSSNPCNLHLKLTGCEKGPNRAVMSHDQFCAFA